MFSLSIVQEATQRALASGALQPIQTQTTLLDDDDVRFVVRAVSSLARKDKARHAAVATDPLGDYDPDLFVADLAPSHYILLNKFQLLGGHVLLVSRRFERQELLLTVEDFAARITCLSQVDGLGFYNGGAEAGASQLRKHLQLVPLPLARDSPDEVPMERVLDGGARLRGLVVRAFAEGVGTRPCSGTDAGPARGGNATRSGAERHPRNRRSGRSRDRLRARKVARFGRHPGRNDCRITARYAGAAVFGENSHHFAIAHCQHLGLRAVHT